MFRKILFWSHLGCGVIAGLVILMMSFTGVLLTYERQILELSARSAFVPADQQDERLPLEQLAFIARSEHGEFSPTAAVIHRDNGAPVTFTAGRQGSVSLNPFTGEVLDVASPGLEAFFRTVTGIHRWFNLQGEGRNTARAITGASNLIFLFIILSGLYLWFPGIWKWGMFRIRLLFRNYTGDSKARDFNWHHVLGIWSAIPLIFIVATASVFYYPWANTLVYGIYSEQAPVRGRRDGPETPAESSDFPGFAVINALSLDELHTRTSHYLENNWRTLTYSLPGKAAIFLNVTVDQGNGGQPQHRHNLVLHRETGDVVQWRPFSSQSPGSRTRSIIRFLHTGEVLGLWGQTIAGLVSLTSLVMVWTGLALAWRRLVSPLLKKKSSPLP